VYDAAPLPDQFFEQSITNGLERAALYLALCQNGMDRSAQIMRSCQLEHSHFAGIKVDLNFCNVCAPRIDRVSIAGIGLVVPFDAWRVGVADESPQSAMLGDVLPSDLRECLQVSSACDECALDQFYFGSAVPFGNKVEQLLPHLGGR